MVCFVGMYILPTIDQYTCVCVCARTHTHTHTHTHTCTHTYTHIYTYSHTYTHSHTYIHKVTHSHTHTHRVTHIHTHRGGGRVGMDTEDKLWYCKERLLEFLRIYFFPFECTVEPRYITKPSYNKVMLLVPALYIFFVFYPDIMRNLLKRGNFHGPKVLVITRFHWKLSLSWMWIPAWAQLIALSWA